jgi:uncharacterized small protein (DUF1192 family)
MGASREQYLTMIRYDGEIRLQAHKFFHKKKELEKEIELLKKEIETLKNDRDEYKKGM